MPRNYRDVLLQLLGSFPRSEVSADTKRRFEAEFKCFTPSHQTIARIRKALEIVSPNGFIFAFQSRLAGDRNIVPRNADRAGVMQRFLVKIEAARPVVEVLVKKAKEKGLSARLERNPFLTSIQFPTLIFRDKIGGLFWVNFEPTGRSLTIRHIQGMKCKTKNREDPRKLARLQSALKAMGYKRLRDGMFEDICTASKGRFGKVHYQHPSKDWAFTGDSAIFFALARRRGLKRTSTRATRVLRRA